MATSATGALRADSWRADAPPPRPSLAVLQGPRDAAVVDLGSNSWRVETYRYVPGGWWRHAGRLQEPVRIAAGLARSGRLRAPAMTRAVDTLDVFARYCRARGISPEDASVVATSAIRDAANGEELIARAEEATGFSIRVLSSEDEARYGYLAAVNSTTLEDGIVLDLGGGSLQLVGVRDRRPTRLGSWPLGAVRVTERLLAGTGSPSRKELRRARAEIRQELADAAWVAECGSRAVAIGGSVRNLAAATGRREGSRLGSSELHELTVRLAKLPVRRRALPGIKPSRADVILGAALVLEAVLELAGLDGFDVTPAGLREGVFFADHLHAGADALVEDVRRASVLNLAERHDADVRHASRVAALALELHDSLVAAGAVPEDAAERELLWTAATLHDIGVTIGYEGHPGHSEYIVRGADLPGFDAREVDLVARMVRAYRRGATEPDRLVARCALLVRFADCLDYEAHDAVRHARLDVAGRTATLELEGDQRLARWTLERQMDRRAFRRVFGLRLM